MGNSKKSMLAPKRLVAPLALLAAPFAGVAVLYGYVSYYNAHLRPPPPPPQSLVFREGEDHPVTPEMVKAARELGGVEAPPFTCKDIDGKLVSLASLSRDKPVVLFFVELQCPCCKGAKPYIDRIKNYYGDVCNVVGIIDAKPDMAKLWSQTVGPQFDVIPDPTMSIVRSYKADRGTYTTLIAPGGKIVKAYPGYCQDMLKDITGKIVRLAGIKPRAMPLEPAPKQMTSGCIFPGTKLPGDEL